MDARNQDLIKSLKKQLKAATDPQKKKQLEGRIAALKKEFTPASDSTGTGIPSRMPTRKNIEGTGIPSRITVPKPKTAAKHILNDDPKLAQANEFEGVKKPEKKGFSLSDLFDSSKYKKTSGPDDYSPAKRTYDTPLGEIDLDTSKEGMFDDSELYDMGQKKGGRLKKAAGKKAAGKKAVKKSATRKRAALRGHRAELRGG